MCLFGKAKLNDKALKEGSNSISHRELQIKHCMIVLHIYHNRMAKIKKTANIGKDVEELEHLLIYR